MTNDSAISFTMQFESLPKLALNRTEFRHPLLAAPLRAIRGKSDGGLLGYGSFQWTNAVQAMAVLFLNVAIAKQSSLQACSAIYLEGQKNSLAASLSYAISKKPVWLLDMFGVDSSGVPLLSRLVRFINSGWKLSETVVVGIPSSSIQTIQVRVALDGREIVSAEKIQRITEFIDTRPPRPILSEALQ